MATWVIPYAMGVRHPAVSQEELDANLDRSAICAAASPSALRLICMRGPGHSSYHVASVLNATLPIICSWFDDVAKDLCTNDALQPKRKASQLCECGAHAVGIPDHHAGHSFWCPAK